MNRRAHLSFAFAIVIVFAFLAACLKSATDEDVDAAATEPKLHEFDMYVGGIDYEPTPGVTIASFGFGLSPEGPFTVPGPEIRVREGDTLRVRLHTAGGGLSHTIHWHGLTLPWAMDGVPFMTQTIELNDPSVYTYEFQTVESGTYWYHCHVDAPTHIDGGLFGALIIEPRDPEYDPPFDREATLILHEVDSEGIPNSAILFGSPENQEVPENPGDFPQWAQWTARDGIDFSQFFLPPEASDAANTGMWARPREYYPDASLRYRPHYDTFMINGKSFPHTEPVSTKTGDTLRIRVIHAGQLVHTVHLHGHHFLVTHKDGYKLAAPYHADVLLIGPGERYDLYVESTNAGMWDLHDHGGGWDIGAYAATDHAFPGGMSTMLVYEDFEYAKLPEPAPGQEWTSGDYRVWSPSYKGLVKPLGWHDTFHGSEHDPAVVKPVATSGGHAHGGDPAPGGVLPDLVPTDAHRSG